MYSAKNSLKVLISNKANFCSMGTTLKTLPVGEIGFFDETGALLGSSVAVLGASGIGTGFFAIRKADGQILKGKTFTSTGWALAKKAYAAPTMETQTVTISTATAGQQYQLRIEMVIPGMQGPYFKHGNYVAVSGDTTSTIATALAASINAALAREDKEYFTITAASNVITIVAKLQNYVRGKKQGRPPVFRSSLVLPEAYAALGVQTVAPSDGIGYGPYICEKEYLAQGDSDPYRFGGYPNSFDDRGLVGLATGKYDVFPFTVDSAVHTNNTDVYAPQQYLIALNTVGATAIPRIDAAVNGATSVTGTSVPGATVTLYVNGSLTDTVTANSTTGVWTASQTVATGEVLTAYALLAPGTISAVSTAVTVTAS